MRQSFALPVSLLLSLVLRVQVSPVFMQETVLPNIHWTDREEHVAIRPLLQSTEWYLFQPLAGIEPTQ